MNKIIFLIGLVAVSGGAVEPDVWPGGESQGVGQGASVAGGLQLYARLGHQSVGDVAEGHV